MLPNMSALLIKLSFSFISFKLSFKISLIEFISAFGGGLDAFFVHS